MVGDGHVLQAARFGGRSVDGTGAPSYIADLGILYAQGRQRDQADRLGEVKIPGDLAHNDARSDVLGEIGGAATAAYTAALPLTSKPGTVFTYATGFSNIAMLAMRRHIESGWTVLKAVQKIGYMPNGIAANLARVLPQGSWAEVDRSTWSPSPVFRVLSDIAELTRMPVRACASTRCVTPPRKKSASSPRERIGKYLQSWRTDKSTPSSPNTRLIDLQAPRAPRRTADGDVRR